jgi:hypothetical protein
VTTRTWVFSILLTTVHTWSPDLQSLISSYRIWLRPNTHHPNHRSSWRWFKGRDISYTRVLQLEVHTNQAKELQHWLQHSMSLTPSDASYPQHNLNPGTERSSDIVKGLKRVSRCKHTLQSERSLSIHLQFVKSIYSYPITHVTKPITASYRSWLWSVQIVKLRYQSGLLGKSFNLKASVRIRPATLIT